MKEKILASVMLVGNEVVYTSFRSGKKKQLRAGSPIKVLVETHLHHYIEDKECEALSTLICENIESDLYVKIQLKTKCLCTGLKDDVEDLMKKNYQNLILLNLEEIFEALAILHGVPFKINLKKYNDD